jgi:hypothetical protein
MDLTIRSVSKGTRVTDLEVEKATQTILLLQANIQRWVCIQDDVLEISIDLMNRRSSYLPAIVFHAYKSV